MTAIILYTVSIVLLLISLGKDKNKTKRALLIAIKSFENIMPQFLAIVLIVGFTLAILNQDTISKLLGSSSGIIGILFASIVGSITTMPTFVAFSLGNTLLSNGAGYSQVGALVSSLTLVGVITYSLESKYIGKKGAFLRNFIAFLFSIIVGLFLGWFLL